MLSKADPDYKSKADIKWNFTKFLVAKNGVVGYPQQDGKTPWSFTAA